MQLKHQIYLTTSLCVLSLQTLKAQVGYGTNLPDQSAVVDMVSKNKGLLIPRINLSGTNLTTPITTPIANSLLIFNTATAGSFPNSVTPGYYYFSTNTNSWIKLSDDPTWNISGNTNTTPYTNYIGTMDDQDLVFKINNIQSGLLNSSSRNTSFGLSSLNENKLINTGTDNVAVGYTVLGSNTTGSFNTGGGYGALTSNTIGDANTSIGLASLEQNTIGKHNTAIGVQALSKNSSGDGNIAMLPVALLENIDGKYNVAIGYSALEQNTSGNNNIAVGLNSLQQNLTGNDNVAIGLSSLISNNKNNSVAIGSYSLSTSVSENNTAMGYFSLITSQIGSNNTAYGEAALGSVGDQSLADNSNNTGLGTSAGSIFFTGSNNTALGVNTGFDNNNNDNIANNQLNIANIIFGTGLNGNVNAPAGNIGIATALPNSTLEVAGSVSTKIRALTSQGEVAQDNDHTILLPLNYNLGLSDPSSDNEGRIYYIINISNQTHAINTSTTNNYFRDSGVNFNTITLDTTTGSRGVMLQSNGTYWIIVNKY